LEFLGDRVLGLSMAQWLYELFPNEPEGMLSRRINVLVSGATCAGVAREIGVAERVRVDKGVKADLRDSDNVLGDICEALLAALYLEAGHDAARTWVRDRWADLVHARATARKHPKAALQEWAAAHRRGQPNYQAVEESGPDHLPMHTVVARLGAEERTATASTKREAETEAARLLLEALIAAPKHRRKHPRLARSVSAGGPAA
jgi:ribonuclease-3